MNQIVELSGLRVASALSDFIANEALPGTGVSEEQFWSGLQRALQNFSDRNRSLLLQRNQLQAQIDVWHQTHELNDATRGEYQQFLEHIGYLVKGGDEVQVTTQNVDPEIAETAGPQLVVPLSNARFALNAANARWGSLFDAFYGTDVIASAPGVEAGSTYNPKRGDLVVARGQAFLDEILPLSTGSHTQVTDYLVAKQNQTFSLRMTLADDSVVTLQAPKQFVGFTTEGPQTTLLFVNHGLHIELQIDKTDPVGATVPSGLKDIVLESALSTIQDCEDSVAAVDAQDKVAVYRNWLGLMRGDLQESFNKNGRQVVRTLQPDRVYTDIHGSQMSLPGRSLMLVRNVGLLMTTDAVLDEQGREIPEGILDAFVTVLCCLHDLAGEGPIRNSRSGSIYIVKPKLHGPEEASFTNDLFTAVEQVFGLDPNTIKVGVMDEERRTTVNLRECIRAVSERVVFINTGFLDRTGDEIHTCMEAGPVIQKEAIKGQPWIAAYENNNVDAGLASGMMGRGQIGKGMWPKPDNLSEMLATKGAHPQAGANCAWVPSPTAATLHAIHYHQHPVQSIQKGLLDRPAASLEDILTPPLLDGEELSDSQINTELENNAQGILGYVARWVEQGVGCSKVPDINDVGLMEDRATLRISSQHIANWLHHGLCSKEQVLAIFTQMASVVDEQNAGDPGYKPMTDNLEQSAAFQAACDLVFKGREQPNGYTEPLLHAWRRRVKQAAVNN